MLDCNIIACPCGSPPQIRVPPWRQSSYASNERPRARYVCSTYTVRSMYIYGNVCNACFRRQVCRQYLSAYECEGVMPLKGAWKAAALAQTKRKAGEDPTNGAKIAPMPKRRRVGAMKAMIELDNQLRQMTNLRLLDFFIRKDPSGSLPDPYTWNRLALCPDKGPSNVAFYHYLAYHRKYNVHCDWDGLHDSNNSSKGALQEVGLWRREQLWVAANNFMYGSTLSPPRHQQVQELFDEMIETSDGTGDAWLQHWMPKIVKDLKLDIDITSETAVKDCGVYPIYVTPNHTKV